MQSPGIRTLSQAGKDPGVIGLLGGMSWESSAVYYRLINEGIRDRLGGHHNARSVMYTVNFHDVEALQASNRWDDAAALLQNAARRVHAGGAGILLLCTNTMHKLADQVQAAVPELPLLHIADATATVIRGRGLNRIGLLGTRYTMEQDFYKGRLEQKYGLEVVVPNENDREIVHRVIYNELVLGRVEAVSRDAYAKIMDKLVKDEGVEGVILGCTEIGLLVSEEQSPVPVFDTTLLHAEAAVRWAIE